MTLSHFKTVTELVTAIDSSVGDMLIKQPLPATGLKQVSPFLLLHHAPRRFVAPSNQINRLSPHPHRGFEPVTFLFAGGAHHKDSLGNEGFLSDGDVQWMTAGSGIIHSEGPSQDFTRQGGFFELIQLWVNLPAQHKMTEPKYQHLPAGQIPVIQTDDYQVKIKIVAGDFAGVRGPATTFTPIIALMVEMNAGSNYHFAIPEGYNSCLYLLEGEGVINENAAIRSFQLANFSTEGATIGYEANRNSRMLLVAGVPILERTTQYGPFVMNTQQEILQAIRDYEAGLMGVLAD